MANETEPGQTVLEPVTRETLDAKIARGARISDEEAAWLYNDAALEDLRRWSTEVKSRFHDPQTATYLIMRIINYTNVCVALCDYCSFYELPKSDKGYVLTKQAIFDKIDEVLALGGDFVGFNGGHNPRLSVDWYADLFRSIREKYGDRIEFYALTVAELIYIARHCKMTPLEAASRLREAGVRWITGGGAEILTNAFRTRHSPLKYTADEYIDGQKQILAAGLRTTATMVVGFDETIEERIEHLRRCRELQDETGGLFSFLTWTYKAFGNQLGGEEITGEEYLRHLAVCRIYLDNVPMIRTSVLTQNANALKGLHFGANDFDIPLEDEVTQKAGATIETDIESVLTAARSEGFELDFRPMALNRTSD